MLGNPIFFLEIIKGVPTKLKDTPLVVVKRHLLANPAPKVAPRWSLAVHKDTNTVDLRSHPRSKDEGGVEYQ